MDQNIVEEHEERAPLSHTLVHEEKHEAEDRLAQISTSMFEFVDSAVYSIVGICFLVGALCALAYSLWDFFVLLRAGLAVGSPADIATSVIQFVSDLLLVLIIMEVLGTIIHYLKARATSLRPFLFIGIVSATRGILSIGARLSVQHVEGAAFVTAMIELGVNAAVILTLGITLKLLGRFIQSE